MKIDWSGCLVSVLGLPLLIPLFPYALTLFILLIFNDTSSKETTAVVAHGLLYVKLGLGLAALLFFGGVYWMFRGRDQDAGVPEQKTGPPDAEDRS